METWTYSAPELLGDAVGTRHDRLHGEDGRRAAEGDEVADHQGRRVFGTRGILDQSAQLRDRGLDCRAVVLVGGRHNRLAVPHGVDRAAGGIEHIDAVLAVIGMHPLAEIFRHPSLIAVPGSDDGIVPDGDAGLLAHDLCHLVGDAGDDEGLLLFQRIPVGLQRGEEAESDHDRQRERHERKNDQRDLRGQRVVLGL